MGIEQAPTSEGKAAAAGLKTETGKEEREVESRTGRDLKKGAARVEERSRSSDGKGAGEKQKG
jgi:hypothetical protein